MSADEVPPQQLLVSSADGGQPIVLSAEDAAQLLAQAGLQLAPGGEAVPADQQAQEVVQQAGGQVVLGAAQAGAAAGIEGQEIAGLVAAGQQAQGEVLTADGAALGDIDDGTILYIDPNDPQAAEILQQAGLQLAEDGTVSSMAPVVSEAAAPTAETIDTAGMDLMAQAAHASQLSEADVVTTSAAPVVVPATVAAAAPAAAPVTTAQQQLAQPPVDIKPVISTALETGEVANGGQQILEQALASTIGREETSVEQLSASSVEPISTTAASSVAPQAVASSSAAPVMATAAAPLPVLPTAPLPPQQVGATPTASPPAKTPSLPNTPLTPAKAASVAASTSATVPTPAPAVSASPANPASAPPLVSPSKQIQVGPDQQKVDYTVTSEDGKTQQYVMLCPKNMDQNLLIQTLVKQISSDPSTRSGKKTIRITQQKDCSSLAASKPVGAKAAAGAGSSTPAAQSRAGRATPRRATPKQQQLAQTPQTPASASPAALQQPHHLATKAVAAPAKSVRNDLFLSQPIASGVNKTVIDPNEIFESVVPDLPVEPADGSTRVYVRCCYCPTFRSSLNGDTWETILNHILPVAKEEMHTAFYGDLSKHFIRSLRIQINGKQVVRDPATGKEVPQCEVILTHSLVCKKTKREFILTNPDAAFVANLAKHIRLTQPGASQRGNSLLCIFCNSPFTYEDYLRHIQPHLDTILATLNCFAGAYCANFYESSIRATHNCGACSEQEPADLRFLPCTAFSADYSCLKKLQFAVDCFREHYGDNGFLRLNTSTVCRCSVCKNPQQVYCAVFHISTTIIGEDNQEHQDADTQLAVCVNCQKQFINIVMKEEGFEERLKLFQLKNMEQLCSVLRVILNQATALTEQKRTLIYTVQENPSNPKSAVHMVKSADVTQVSPMTRLLALAESEVVGSKVKAQFVCDLCLFTVDLTSLIATEREKQKNDMLLAIVLEHLVPHTESLINVIASTTANQMLALKYDVHARAVDVPSPAQSPAAAAAQQLTTAQALPHTRISLSLKKKFRSLNSKMEIALDKEEEKTMSDIRLGIKSERKAGFTPAQKLPKGQTPPNPHPPSDGNTAAQLMEVNRFIDKHRGKFGVLYQTGCNTTLLNAYTECRLCSKFSFPDFRLTGAATLNTGGTKSIDLCENCVETVLSLCLPTEPECLPEAEECLALGEARLVGHRLVLSNNLKKWLSLDGVNLIKKTIDEFERVKLIDCSNLFLSSLKKHMAAVLKTLQQDQDITHAATGFCINDSFLQLDKKKEDSATAMALASLQEQVGMPIIQAKEPTRHEVQVTILSRRLPGQKSAAAAAAASPATPSASGNARNGVITLKGGNLPGSAKKANGTVINLGGNVTQLRKVAAEAAAAKPQAIVRVGAAQKMAAKKGKATSPAKEAVQSQQAAEESISAIQNFLDETAASLNEDGDPIDVSSDVKVPAGIKITSAGKGVVNIRAVADSPKASGSSPPKSPMASPSASPTRAKNSVRGLKGVSMVTVTSNGAVTQLPGAAAKAKDHSDDEGDTDEEEMPKTKKRKASEAAQAAEKKAKIGASPLKETPKKDDAAAESSEDTTPSSSRSGRQRRQKKIFDL